MQISQRLLYVGIGGTGLRIGAQLEQALRLELCGVERRIAGADIHDPSETSELPSFTQFVYVDLDEGDRIAAELAGRRSIRPTPARKTRHFIDLTPTRNDYPAVAAQLRIAASSMVEGWLPPPPSEPRVAPLQSGSGQYPTVARAAFFDSVRRGGLAHLTAPLTEAVVTLANAERELTAYLGHPPLSGCNVFVGFSVAGGTGAGLFYDYLRLVAVEVASAFGAGSSIYPLVVAPSAFRGVIPGGRQAELNGGPALRDLFALVDEYNLGMRPPPVAYPDASQPLGAQLEPSDVGARTAFVFSRPLALSLFDLQRSIVAFILSLVGTEVAPQYAAPNASFPSTFVNRSGELQQPARDGIGRHPASTALATQLTVPLDAIAAILSSRLIAQGVTSLQAAKPGEDNESVIARYLDAVGLTPLVTRPGTDTLPPLPASANGAAAISACLVERSAAASRLAETFDRTAHERVRALLDALDLAEGIRTLAATCDPFRISRIVLGHGSLESASFISQAGVVGFFDRRTRPYGDPGLSGNPAIAAQEPPNPPRLKDRALLLRVRADDAAVTKVLEAQDAWYHGRIAGAWHTAWARHEDEWQPKVTSLRSLLLDVTDALARDAADEPRDFREKCQLLYRRDVRLVSHLLPDGGADNDLTPFYEGTILPRLRARLGLSEEADAAAVLNRIIGSRWVDAYERAMVGSAAAVVDSVKVRVEAEVMAVLIGNATDGAPLPRLSALLADAAAGANNAGTWDSSLVMRFAQGVEALLPPGPDLSGPGSPAVDVFYPAAGASAEIEAFLRSRLGRYGPDAIFHQTADANYLGVILSHVGIASTEVGEYRSLMRAYAEARDHPRDADFLPWRQRLGYDGGWIVLTHPDDRVQVLLRLLNALWDGSVHVAAGAATSPERIIIMPLDASDAPPMELTLHPRGNLSRWSDFLPSYERYALREKGRRVPSPCEALMSRATPASVADQPAPPSDVYVAFRSIVEDQARLARQLYENAVQTGKRLAYQTVDFWENTVTRALRHEFYGGGGPEGRNHDQLYRSLRSSSCSSPDDGMRLPLMSPRTSPASISIPTQKLTSGV